MENPAVPHTSFAKISALIGRYAERLEHAGDLDSLMERIGDARYVLLGEASHGTHEYYTWRMRISRRLIEEKGFSFIAVEGDWPDCYRVNRYVKGYTGADEQARDVLGTFNRWPTWMWANWETVAFMEWLREHNDDMPRELKVGFYGLDIYSLFESLESIIGYLEKNDPVALADAKRAMACFEPFGHSEEYYARATSLVPEVCSDEVMKLFDRIRDRIPAYDSDPEHVFSTAQNAYVSVNAEKYYRAMMRGGVASWNIRDTHMSDTLDRLMEFHGSQAKAIIWAHNTHIGDARATDMAATGMVNIGQLIREKNQRKDVVLVGFGSHRGMVVASDNWGDPMKEMEVPVASENSWEDLFHRGAGGNKLLLTSYLEKEIGAGHITGQRAIGVVYHPYLEKYGNYVPSDITARYDAFVFLDETTALHPLHVRTDKTQMPETYPFGI